MIELGFVFVSVLIYLVSFIYRRISILAAFVVVFAAFNVNVNLVFILLVMLSLTLIRFKKSGVKEEN